MANEGRGRGEGSLSLTRPLWGLLGAFAWHCQNVQSFQSCDGVSALAVCDTRCMVIVVHGITLYVMP